MNKILIDNLSNKLLGILAEETAHFELLLNLLKDEERAIVESNILEVNRAREQKNDLFEKANMCGSQSDDLLHEMAKVFSFSQEKLTVFKLCKLVDQANGVELYKSRSKLLELGKKIKEQNQKNMALLKHSLFIIRESLNKLNSLASPGLVYHKTGNIYKGCKSGVVFSNEA